MSDVDDTFPPNNEKVSKADMREQFGVIKAELEVLEAETSLAYRMLSGLVSI